jgi:hypothetical protein
MSLAAVVVERRHRVMMAVSAAERTRVLVTRS